MIHPTVKAAFKAVADEQIEMMPVHHKSELFKEFLHHAEKIWRNPEFVLKPAQGYAGISLGKEEPPRGVLAAVRSVGNIQARDNLLVTRPLYFQLLISERLLGLSAQEITKVMIHEAVHLGYPKHDRDFRELVRQHGGAVSETSVKSPGIQVQMKQGSKFKTIKLFPEDQEYEAIQWAKQESRNNRGGRYRILQSTQPDLRGKRFIYKAGDYKILGTDGKVLQCVVQESGGAYREDIPVDDLYKFWQKNPDRRHFPDPEVPRYLKDHRTK